MARRLVAFVATLGEHPMAEPFKFIRERFSRSRSHRRQRFAENFSNDIAARFADERQFAGDQLKEHDSETEEIRSNIDSHSARLLRRHVMDRTENDSG